MITIIILFLLLMQFFIFSSYEFLNNLSVRSLLIPETDDVEESAKNAKDVNKILSYIRIFVLLLAVLTTSFLHLLYSEYVSSNQIIIIILSSFTSILYLFLLNLFFKLIPNVFLGKFIFAIISLVASAFAQKLTVTVWPANVLTSSIF